MTSPTLARELDRYAIGDRLRALRLKRKLGLVELGRHTGLSPGLLSKLERGRMFPTLPTLLRIALVYGVGLDHFFAPGSARRTFGVVRRGERQTFAETLGGRHVAWTFECLDFTATERRSNAYRVRFQSAAVRPRSHEHPGSEFLHVLSGRLAVAVAGEVHEMGPGDSLYFDASLPHSYRRLSARPPEAIVVTVPA